MNIQKIIKEHHQAMIEKGFYDCPNCKGVGKTAGEYKKSNLSLTRPKSNPCIHCNGTRIDPNKNIGELLMLIVSELSEALEAHRNNRFADWEAFNQFVKGDEEIGFEDCIKDTLGDKVAGVFLRLLDLCGYLGIEPSPSIPDSFKYNINNIGEILLKLSDEIIGINNSGCNEYNISRAIYFLWCASVNNWNIPIEKHIKAKMAYNKTRPHKHGKEY